MKKKLNQTLCINSYLRRLGIIFILSTVSSCVLLQKKSVIHKTPDAGLQTVHTLDVYAERNDIHVLFSGMDRNSQQLVVRYINSHNAGATWSAAVTVNQGDIPVKQSKRGNDFQIAARGDKIMTVWREQGSEPWVGIIASAMSIDGGKTWQKINSPVSEKYANIDQGYFDLAVDLHGQFHIAWLDDREEVGNTQTLHYARYNGNENHWKGHKVLENSACTCCWSDISVDNKGHVHILYRDDNPRDMLTISSLDGGDSWQTPNVVWPFEWEFIGCPHQGGGLATTQRENKTLLHSIVWNGVEEDRGLYYSHSELIKGIKSPLEYVDSEWSDSGDIAALNDNHIAVVYTTREEEKKRVMAKFSKDGGESWSAVQRLSGKDAEPSHPRVVSTSEGFRFFWTEWQDNGDAIGIMSELQ